MHRLRRVARTIADLAAATGQDPDAAATEVHLAEAAHLRRLPEMSG
jgi:predicted ATPase with chaperone activity